MKVVYRSKWVRKGEEFFVVGIAEGGLDQVPHDALRPIFPNELEVLPDPGYAPKIALKIVEEWIEDYGHGASIAIHCQDGPCIELGSGCSYNELEYAKKVLHDWACDEKDKLPRCPDCGSFLGVETHRIEDDEKECCSPGCAENHNEKCAYAYYAERKNHQEIPC